MAHLFKKVSPGDTQTIGKYKIGTPYKIKGRWYHPKEEFRKIETGIASWYGPNFHRKPTANGEIFDQNALTAAHRTLQIPSIVRVTNLDNGRSLILRVNDRGPFSRGRILDVSKRGAELLGFQRAGTARIKLEVIEEASRYAASQAKKGLSTAGMEIALNKGEPLPVQTAAIQQKQTPEPLQTAALAPSEISKPDATIASSSPRGLIGSETKAPVAQVKRQSIKDNRANNALESAVKNPEDMVDKSRAVKTELYVQAGAFSNYGNAARLRTSLARLGESRIYEAQIEGQKFYRVRIGPMQSVTRADTVLEALASMGNQEAVIIVR